MAGTVAVLIAVVGLSAGSTMVKKTGSPGAVVAFWRLLVGAALWQVVLLATRTKVTLATWRRVAPAGALFGVNLVCFFSAVTLTRIANAEFIGTLAPAIVVPIAAFLLRERVAVRTIVLAGVALCGVALVVFGSGRGGGHRLIGDALALGAVSTWAAYLLFTKHIRGNVDTKAFMAVMTAVAAVVVLPFALRTGKMSEVTTKGWVLIVAMAVTSGMISHGLLAWAQRKVPVSTISVLQLAQPGIATTWAYLFLDQHVKPLQLLGMAIVVVAVAFVALGTARRAQQDNTLRRAQQDNTLRRAQQDSTSRRALGDAESVELSAADLAARSIIEG